MKNISLGQYYPADSLIHRLDGRTKILLATIFIISVFFCKSLASFAFLLLTTFAVVLFSKIPLRVVFRSLRAIVFILVFTFVINIFLTKGDSAPIVDWWIIEIYTEGIWTALFISLTAFFILLR